MREELICKQGLMDGIDFYLKSALEKPVNKNMPRGNVHLFYSELVVKLKIITIKI